MDQRPIAITGRGPITDRGEFGHGRITWGLRTWIAVDPKRLLRDPIPPREANMTCEDVSFWAALASRGRDPMEQVYGQEE